MLSKLFRGYNEPLGLPRGSVRALITLLVVIPFPVVLLLSAFGHSVSGEQAALYSAVLFIVVKDYFGTRAVDTASTEASEPGDLARDV